MLYVRRRRRRISDIRPSQAVPVVVNSGKWSIAWHRNLAGDRPTIDMMGTPCSACVFTAEQGVLTVTRVHFLPVPSHSFLTYAAAASG